MSEEDAGPVPPLDACIARDLTEAIVGEQAAPSEQFEAAIVGLATKGRINKVMYCLYQGPKR
jgi:hypothetical protein